MFRFILTWVLIGIALFCLYDSPLLSAYEHAALTLAITLVVMALHTITTGGLRRAALALRRWRLRKGRALIARGFSGYQHPSDVGFWRDVLERRDSTPLTVRRGATKDMPPEIMAALRQRGRR